MPRSTTIARLAALAGLISAASAWSAPAFADGEPLPHAAIALHGADLTSPRAIGHLKRRLRHLAADICTAYPGEMLMNRSESACYDTAMKDGLAQIAFRQQQALRLLTVRLAGTDSAAQPD